MGHEVTRREGRPLERQTRATQRVGEAGTRALEKREGGKSFARKANGGKKGKLH